MIRFMDKPIFGLALALAASCLGCGEDGDKGIESEPTAPEVTQAIARVSPTEGNEAQGTVEFSQEADKVRVIANLTGLTEGNHGFHIHEKGDCSAADGTSAGGHFNPENKAHGAPYAAERHVGDLGNIFAEASGQATYNRVDTLLELNGDNSIIGLAVIVHALPDDFSQPTGAAGARVGCGVIEGR